MIQKLMRFLEIYISKLLRNSHKYIFIYMRWKKNTTKQNPTPQSNKWVQNGGTSIDDITFTNGEVEVNFDEWIEKYYNK